MIWLPVGVSTNDETDASLHHRVQNFKNASTGVAAKAMRNELNKLVKQVENPEEKTVCR
jgi:UTP--glucose-1-phosphate uridylyltransferase